MSAILLSLNHLKTDYADLSVSDQKILTEFDVYCKADQEQPLWPGYNLSKQPLLIVSGRFGSAFLINPTGKVIHLLAAKISMPADSSLEVYRVSLLAPQTLPLRFGTGRFNTIGARVPLFDNDIYYFRHDGAASLDAQYSDKHFITFLSHEAFHYYMQDNWAGGSRFAEELSPADLDLIGTEYDTLAKIQEELSGAAPSKELLLRYAGEYAAVMEQRIAANPMYLNAELSMETAEGTATYIGIQASARVGYDYGVMYFNNVKNVSFSEVIPMLKSGNLTQSFLADRMPYETGALLCQLLDTLQVPDWKNALDAQTLEHPVTLHSIISGFVS